MHGLHYVKNPLVELQRGNIVMHRSKGADLNFDIARVIQVEETVTVADMIAAGCPSTWDSKPDNHEYIILPDWLAHLIKWLVATYPSWKWSA